MTGALMALPANLRKRLVDELESGSLHPPFPAASLHSILGVKEGADGVSADLSSLIEMGLSASGCASWIRSVEAEVSRTPYPDLVWSGPEVPGVHARDTRQVYEQLLSSAERNIWACSFVYFDGHKAFDALARRMDAKPELRVILMLNIKRGHNDTSIPTDVVRRFADRFWKTDWPGKARPQVYYDPRSLEPERPGGVLHAKAVVTDDESVFITSANLTEAALDRNIEIGLLVRDRALALSVTSHFRALIDQRLLSPLPAS
ncbi:MAG: DISARM system phospholipase D-like protein DrmC [Acidobacteriota bacterium]|nr:DISARM system phospholipase D-like protein DrmC [Acidobacteriota bacterium]